MGNLGLAVVYEWDHASKSLLYKNSITKTSWRYDKKVFKLYKSAELHTKQRRSIPGLVWFVLVGLIALAYFAPSTYARLNERTSPKPAASAASGPRPGPGVPGSVAAVAPGAIPAAPASAPAPPLPVVAGCAVMRGVCRCYDAAGLAVEPGAGVCEAQTKPGPSFKVDAHQLAALESPHESRPFPEAGMIEDLVARRARNGAPLPTITTVTAIGR